jgi:hypothetical protein
LEGVPSISAFPLYSLSKPFCLSEVISKTPTYNLLWEWTASSWGKQHPNLSLENDLGLLWVQGWVGQGRSKCRGAVFFVSRVGKWFKKQRGKTTWLLPTHFHYFLKVSVLTSSGEKWN